MPKISIIIPSFNSIAYYEECIKSVINQSLKDIEILCVDARSSDGTLELIQKYALKDKRIKLILSEQKSYGYQMNLGIEKARGEYLGMVESDDYIDIFMYEKLLKTAQKYEACIVKANMIDFEDGEETRIFHPHYVTSQKSLYNKILNSKNLRIFTQAGIMNPSGIFKLDFLRKNQIYHNQTPGAAFQDTAFWFKTSLLAQNMIFLDEALYYYRRDNENSSCNYIPYKRALNLGKEYDSIRNFLNKHQEFKHFIPLVSYLRFSGYNWILGRILDEDKFLFLQNFQKDFKELDQRKELDKKFFSEYQIKKLERIMKNPYEFYENVASKPKGAVLKVKQSLAYVLGSQIIKAKNPIKILKLPFILFQIIKKPYINSNLELESFSDYYEALALYNHLSYRLGLQFLKAYEKRYKGAFFLFLFKAIFVYKEYIQYKKRRVYG